VVSQTAQNGSLWFSIQQKTRVILYQQIIRKKLWSQNLFCPNVCKCFKWRNHSSTYACSDYLKTS